MALFNAINISYEAQLAEGMETLPTIDTSVAKKYCGGGWGGYALYCFTTKEDRDNAPVIKIEPYMDYI